MMIDIEFILIGVYNLLVKIQVVFKMKKYLLEIHSHTDEVSNCGQMPAAQMVGYFKERGYSGMMITDHLHSYTFKKLLKNKPDATWDDRIDYFLRGYSIAYEEAKKVGGFSVYLGAELRFDENDNDYLIFGLSEDKLRKMKDICAMGTEDGIKLVKSLGCTVIQAHPFRNDCVVVEPGIYDGVEVYNGHPGHDSRNDIALMWGKKFNYIMTSGSDFHGEYEPNSGIYVDKIPKDEDELRQIILNGDFELKTNA